MLVAAAVYLGVPTYGCPYVWVSLRMLAWDLSSIQTCVVARPLDRDVQVQGSLPPLFQGAWVCVSIARSQSRESLACVDFSSLKGGIAPDF